MGEKVLVGKLYFMVTQTSWETHLGDGAATRTPTNRFLIVHLTVSNSGGEDLGVPLLTLEDNKGESFREVQEGTGIPEWLGLVRRVSPAETESGNIAFDVPPAAYRLRLAAHSFRETVSEEPEETALVDLPLDLEPK